MAKRKLGKRQRITLWSLVKHGSFHSGCGWIWDNYSTTVTVVESLVVRGYAEKREVTTASGSVLDVYRPTDAGRAVLLRGGEA